MDQSLKYLKDAFDLNGVNVDALSPLMLAYAGDAVYELVIRTVLLKTGGTATKKINKRAIGYVSAGSQAAIAEKIRPLLSEKETGILRRGRNAHSATTAKNASVADYRMATGFEALMGYLYLSGQWERMVDLIKAALEDEDERDEA